MAEDNSGAGKKELLKAVVVFGDCSFGLVHSRISAYYRDRNEVHHRIPFHDHRLVAFAACVA